MIKNSLLSITSLSVALFITGTATAQVPVPFSTSIRNYAYIGKTGLNANVATISLHQTTNPATTGGGFGPGTTVTFVNGNAQDLNAAGINSVDGFMYGLEYLYAGPATSDATLYRIGANAVAGRLGTIAAPTAADAGRTIQFSYVNLASGTIDSVGNYWFTGYTYTDLGAPFSGTKIDFFLGKISGINTLTIPLPAATLPTLTPTYYKLNVSDPAIQTGFANLMNQQAAMIAYGLPPTNADGGWQDMDINPLTHEFYSYIGFPSAATPLSTPGNPISPYPKPVINSYLVRIDHTTSPMTVVVINSTPNTTPNREEDGAFFDGAGNFYVGFTDGEYSPVNLSTGALSNLAQSALPLFNANLRGDFATNTPITPLPLTLISFEARKAAGSTVVTWHTATESELDHFELERSAECKHFTLIGSIAAANAGTNYSYTDQTATGNIYYRLRSVNIDGTAIYSQIIKIAAEPESALTTVYPTVVSDGKLHLSSPAPRVAFDIRSVAGQAVQTGSLNTGPGARLSVATLPSGTYFICLTDAATGAFLSRAVFIIP